jgi:hypothetical protein
MTFATIQALALVFIAVVTIRSCTIDLILMYGDIVMESIREGKIRLVSWLTNRAIIIFSPSIRPLIQEMDFSFGPDNIAWIPEKVVAMEI